MKGNVKGLLNLEPSQVDALREPLLPPFGRTLEAPNKVALYLFTGGGWVIENFNDQAVTVRLDGVEHTIAPRSWVQHWN